MLLLVEADGKISAPLGRLQVCICTEYSDLVGIEPSSGRKCKEVAQLSAAPEHVPDD